jgi:hypothetical protein
LIWYSLALLLAREEFVHVSVSHEQVYGDHWVKTACTHFIHSVCKIYTQGTVQCVLKFYYWLHTNSQLLPLMLSTDEATFARTGNNDTSDSFRWPHDNQHGTVETNFQRLFCISAWCVMFSDMSIGPVILDDHITGQNYINFLQNGLPEQLRGCSFGYTDRYVLLAWRIHISLCPTRVAESQWHSTLPVHRSRQYH